MWMTLAVLGCTEGPRVDAAVLSGWNLAWDELSHRMSYVETALEPSGAATMGLIGGDWSTGDEYADLVDYRLGVHEVSSSRLGFAGAEGSLVLAPEASDEVLLRVVVNALLLARA